MMTAPALACLAMAVAAPGGDPALPPGARSAFHSLREKAKSDLAGAGEEGRAAAVAGLADPDYRVRRLCLEALARTATRADLDAIAGRFRDPDRAVRTTAAEAFFEVCARAGELGPERALAGGAAKKDVGAAIRRIVRHRILALFDLANPLRYTYDRRFAPFMALGPSAASALRDAAVDLRLAPSVRAVAIVALARLGNRADVPFLVEFGRADLEHRPRSREREIQEEADDPLNAVAAGLFLAGTDDPKAIDLLTEIVDHNPSAIARQWAEWALIVAAEIGGKSVHNRIASSSLSALRTDGDPAVLAAAAQALGLLAVREAVPDLLQAAEKERGAYAVWYFLEAAWNLTAGETPPGIPEEQTRAAVLQSFERVAKRGKPPAVAFARVCLGQAAEGREELVQRLYRIIEGRESTEEGEQYDLGPRSACAALALLGEHAAVPALQKACETGSDDVRQAAMIALGQLGDAVAIPTLKKGLEEQNEFNRLFAAQALLAFGDRDALAVFVEALDSGDIFLRRWAISVLAPVRGGESDGYDSLAGVGERREVVARWRLWWRDHNSTVRWNPDSQTFEQK